MHFSACAVSAFILVAAAGVAWGQDYPNRPIHIVTAEAGGGTDFASRVVAQALSRSLGPVIVENKAADLVAGFVAKSRPDGYTLLLLGSTAWLQPLLQQTNYDPETELEPITLVSTSPLVLLLNPSVQANSLKELLDLAKAHPGVLNYGSTGTGSSTHLATELFNTMGGVRTVNVPYRSAGPAMTALLGGEIQMMFATTSAAAPYLKSGGLKVLAVTSSQPSALTPGVPTVADSGLPGYDVEARYVIWAPAKTSSAIIGRLNTEIVRVLNTSDVKEKYLNSGIETIPSSPAQAAAVIKSEIAKWRKVIKDADIHVN